MKRVIEKYKNWNPSNYAIMLLLLTPLFIHFIYAFALNTDFWFLVNTGDEILENGFISIEPFSMHSNLAFVPQQWLTDVIYSLLYNNIGLRGMYVLFLICCYSMLIIFYHLSYVVSNDRKKSFLFSILIFSIASISGFISVRPQIFDFILIALELFLLEKYIKTNNKKYLYFLPLMSILYINLHASIWLMFFIVLIPYYLENIILNIKKKKTFNLRPLILVTIISLLVGLINPYGIDAIKYLFNSYGVKYINSTITEMLPTEITNPIGIFIYLIIFILLYSFYHNKGKNKVRYVLLMMGFTYLSLKHFRGITYLVIIFPLIVGYNFCNYDKEKEIVVTKKDKIIYISSILIIFILLIFKTNLSNNIPKEAFLVANYLDENATKDITIYSDITYAGYLEYRGYKNFIDGRVEVYLKENNKKNDYYVEYIDFITGKLDGNEFINKYMFDYVLLNDWDTIAVNVLEERNDYEKVYQEEVKKSSIYLYKKVSGNEETKTSS